MGRLGRAINSLPQFQLECGRARTQAPPTHLLLGYTGLAASASNHQAILLVPEWSGFTKVRVELAQRVNAKEKNGCANTVPIWLIT